ncbi:MAG TPA: hypothetical protein VFM48_14685 [Aquabacterium sp.]|nr:hypothetical protein [Aquabacterium sp.]
MSRLAWVMRPLFVALVAISLVSAVLGGLMRAGVDWPAVLAHNWVPTAAGLHSALMLCGFFGTVIGLERAVAVKRRWAFLGPLASAVGGVLLLNEAYAAAASAFVCSALVFVGVNTLIVWRQRAVHTVLLWVSAVVWLLANVRFMFMGLSETLFEAWFAFLVITIAAERLEMARLARLSRRAQIALVVILSLMLAGIVLTPSQIAVGRTLFGSALLLLAGWLGRFDVARRTVRSHGLSRYMAVCLLSGYVWLAVSGACWIGQAHGFPVRDAALHALGLGFVMSMVMGHAPVILPAVAGVKLHVDGRFYLPLLALHLSLLVRLAAGHFDSAWKAWGSGMNAAALVLFVITVISAARAWRARHAEGAVRLRTRRHS